MNRVTTSLTSAAAATALLFLAGCEVGPKKIEQTGYRGTGGEQITAISRIVAQPPVPAPPYPLPPDGGPTAGQTYQNVKVLGNVSTERFNHLMAAINQWVAPPEQGCNYCHNPENMASDEKYTKVVARRMLQMTQKINSDWSSHVKQTGVTCYTCHRGNAVPKYSWALTEAPGGSTTIRGNRYGQNAPSPAVAYASLPNDPFATYFGAYNNVRVGGTTPLRGAPGASTKKAEVTYGLMMHMSNSLGVNCTFCHNTHNFAEWQGSRPQRVTAWYGIRMVRDIDQNYIMSLQNVFPANRKGPYGDVYKVNCQTCHQGVNKPLGGVSMIADYPALKGTPAAAPAAPALPETAPAAPAAATTTAATTPASDAAAPPPAAR